MHIAGRAKIKTAYHPATYVYAHHMGSGESLPAQAEAWIEGKRDQGITINVGDMEPEQAIAKARAMLAR